MLSMRHLIVAIATLLLGMGAADAKDGRDFAGFYSVTNVTNLNDQVRATVNLQLCNYSGADLKEAAVRLRETFPGTAVLGTYTPIQLWRNGSDAAFSLHVTVPRDEYQRWSTRRQPNVVVVYRDDQGREWQRAAQISRRPTVPHGYDAVQ